MFPITSHISPTSTGNWIYAVIILLFKSVK